MTRKAALGSGAASAGADRELSLTATAELHTGPTDADPTVAGCVCGLRLPCGYHLRQQRIEQERERRCNVPPYTGTPRYRNTDGLRGHANARKRASD